MSRETATYYDRLSLWTAVSRLFGYGGGREVQTVHRALTDPRADGRATPTRLHDLLLETLPPLTQPRVLDAGCGLGGTMIDLASRVGGTYVGLTLSRRQAAIGRRAIERRRLATSVRILLQSYDAPPPGPYDLILGIESLAHSPAPEVTLRALASQLAPGGLIAVVDDMPDAAAPCSDDLTTFKAGWHCPVLWRAEQYEAGFAACGLSLVANRNLTALFTPRTLTRIKQLERLNRAVHRAIPSAACRSLMSSYQGGLALERLYRNACMDYRLLIARR